MTPRKTPELAAEGPSGLCGIGAGASVPASETEQLLQRAANWISAIGEGRPLGLTKRDALSLSELLASLVQRVSAAEHEQRAAHQVLNAIDLGTLHVLPRSLQRDPSRVIVRISETEDVGIFFGASLQSAGEKALEAVAR
jgi:hypothetical protein